MTYLQLINRVLRALREPQIAGITGEKALFYGQLINEVKEDFENLGPWFALRQRLVGTMVIGNENIDLTAETNERSYVLYASAEVVQAFITTADKETRLNEVTWERMDELHTLDPDAAPAQPYNIAFRTTADGIEAKVFPKPDLAYTYRIGVVVPQDELTSATTALTIPSMPVWREAAVRAMEERGEEFSGPLQSARARAQAALDQAILGDFGREQYTFEQI